MQVPDEAFRVIKGTDLVYTKKISLVDALKGEPVVFKHFDGRHVSVAVDAAISPQTVKLVRGEGMPISKEDSNDPGARIESVQNMEKGDLYIRFDVEFPKSLREDQRQALLEILSE